MSSDKKPTKKDTVEPPYMFTSDEKATLRFLFKEREIAMQKAEMVDGQIRGFITTLKTEKSISPKLQIIDAKNFSGIYATEKDAKEAEGKK